MSSFYKVTKIQKKGMFSMIYFHSDFPLFQEFMTKILTHHILLVFVFMHVQFLFFLADVINASPLPRGDCLRNRISLSVDCGAKAQGGFLKIKIDCNGSRVSNINQHNTFSCILLC